MHPTDQYDSTQLSSVYGGTPRPSVSITEAPPSRNNANCTTTFSMSLGLAQLLQERGILPTGMRSPKPTPKVMVNGIPLPSKKSSTRHTPQRFGSLVTETMSRGVRSQTEVIYTSAPTSTVLTTTNIPPLEGISDTAMPLLRPDTYDILDQVLNNQLEKTASTTAAAVNILGMGLNTILPLNERVGLVTRQDVIEQDRRSKSPEDPSGQSDGSASPSVQKKTTRPTYIGDLPPLGMSRSRGGVMTRVAAASSRAQNAPKSQNSTSTNEPSMASLASGGVLTRVAAINKATSKPEDEVASTVSFPALGTSSASFAALETGAGLENGLKTSVGSSVESSLQTSVSYSRPVAQMSSSSTAMASLGSTLSTSTLSSSYYSSPRVFAGLPAMSSSRPASSAESATAAGASALNSSDAANANVEISGEPLSATTPPSATTTPTPGTMSQSLIKHLANIRMKRRHAGFAGALAAPKHGGLSSILSPSPTSPDSSKKTDVD